MTETLMITVPAAEIELQKRILRATLKYLGTYAKLAIDVLERAQLGATAMVLTEVNAEYAKGVQEQLDGLLRILPDPVPGIGD